jgi:VWFA-related protein
MTTDRPPRGRRALPALAAVFAATTALAQPTPTPGPPSSRAGSVVRSVDVSITNIDVIVSDSKGNRVTGLKKEDFEVVEDGLNQPITNFYAVEGGNVTLFGDEAIPTPPPPPAPGLPAAPPAAAAVPLPKTWMVIFIDNLHLTPFNRNRVLRNVEDWVMTMLKGDVQAMVVTWDRSLKVRRKFTSDARDIADVLRQVEEISANRVSTIGERRDVIQAIDDAQNQDAAIYRVRQYAESLANDLQFTMDAMKTTLNQLSGVEGRKIMVHVSEGLPQSPGAELWSYIQDRFHSIGGMTEQFTFDRTTSYAGIIQSANAAGVSLYMFDASGLSANEAASAENKTTSGRIDTFVERSNLQSMLTMMAEETGGVAVLNRNDVTVPLKEIQKDVASYYSLGYRSLRSGSDRPHNISVKVKRKGLVARARKSYVEKSPDTRASEAVTSALYFPRDDNPLSVGLEVGAPTPADKQNYLVPLRVRVPYARLTMLPEGPKLKGRMLLYFIVVDASGQESDLSTQTVPVELDAKDGETLAKKDFVYVVKLLMIPGGQRLSLAVRDQITNTMSFVQKNIFVSALPPEKKAAGAK